VGIGQRRGCFDRATVLLGRRHPATGSHLPSEETAPPYAVAPFASSPFAHLIPQSHRRASGDLFRASLSRPISSAGSRIRKASGTIRRCRDSQGNSRREQVTEELIAYLKAMSAAKRDPSKQNDRPGLERLSPGG
jgi:hypothetical protein